MEVQKEEAPPQQTLKSFLDVQIRQSYHITRDMSLNGYENEMYNISTLFWFILFISSNLISCFLFYFCHMAKCVSNVKKIFPLNTSSEMWYVFVIIPSGLEDLSNMYYALIDHGILLTFYAKWHLETSNFHILVGEMTMRLENVSFMLHLLVLGRLLNHIPLTIIEEGETTVEPIDANLE